MEELQASYVEAGWGPLLSLLRADARQPLPPNLGSDRAARQAVKDKWAAVNRALGEAAAQAGWAAPDAGLRFALKDSLTEALAPLYAAFTAKYRAAPYTGACGRVPHVGVGQGRQEAGQGTLRTRTCGPAPQHHLRPTLPGCREPPEA